MDVIALISGGKDSFFNILHCIKNGHRIIALANLHPPGPSSSIAPEATTYIPSQDLNNPITISTHTEKDELDSFMYQTVGHNLLPYFATALNLPLYRAPIVGGSVNQDLAYKVEKEDETEDLYRLLSYILTHHPTAKAVSTGAILSTYQRTRVESVCTRLDLTSLSYLWNRPQHELLDEMASVGLDARIVKVAAIGLDADGWLWKNVTDANTRRKLGMLKAKWGVHIAGEGGEYETIVVQGPGWRTRVVVDKDAPGAAEVVLGEGNSGVAHLKIRQARWEKVGDGKQEAQKEWVRNLSKPQLLNRYFRRILAAVSEDCGVEGNETEDTHVNGKTSLEAHMATSSGWTLPLTHSRCTEEIMINNISAPSSLLSSSSIQEEIGFVMKRLSEVLKIYDVPFSRITATVLLLRSMADFPLVNSGYSKHFTEPNPPSRVCVGIGDAMPEGCNILMHVIADTDGQRKGLHIQGRSYWAPANIGPYSQAISVAGLVHISGQIPLAPATMELPTLDVIPMITGDEALDRLKFETVLALQHAWRVARAMKVSDYAILIGFTTTKSGMKIMNQVRRAHILEWEVSEDDLQTNIPNPRLWGWGQDGDLIDQTPYEGVEDSNEDDHISAPSICTSRLKDIPPLLVLQVSQLPRGAPVEWVALGIEGEDIPFRDHDDGITRGIKYAVDGKGRHIHTWRHKRAYRSIVQFARNVSVEELVIEILHLLMPKPQENLNNFVATVYIAVKGGESGLVHCFWEVWERKYCEFFELLPVATSTNATVKEVCNERSDVEYSGGHRVVRDALQVVPVERVWFEEEEAIFGVVIRRSDESAA